MLFATDADKHLVEEPSIARSWPAPFQCVGEYPTKTETLVTHAFITDHNAAGGRDQFDIITQAEAEAVIQPDGVLDDLGGKANARIGVGQTHHAE